MYEETGVLEYWIVHPEEVLLEVFKLDEQGKYQLEKIYTHNDIVSVGIFDDFSIDPNDIFEEELADDTLAEREHRI